MTLPADYIDNYNKIAREHVAYAKANSGGNPFMDPDLVETLEQATEQLVRRYVTPGSAILDAGCGPGTLLARLDDRYNRWGLDMSLDYIHYARDTHNHTINFRPGELEHIHFRDETFDAVLCTDVLEHVLDEHQVLRELIRVLKPGGHLIIRVPDDEDLYPYIPGRGDPNSVYNRYTFLHLRRFDLPTLWLLLDRVHRLDVDEITAVRYPGWNELHAVAVKP